MDILVCRPMGREIGAGGNHDAGNLEPVSSSGSGDGSSGHALPCSLIHCCESHDDGAAKLEKQNKGHQRVSSMKVN